MIFDVQQLAASFSNKAALHGVSLTISDRMVTAIIGPSGCGKTTFLRCLNRLQETTPGATWQGTIKFRGDNILSLETSGLRRSVAMIFPVPSPFPALSIAENVLAGLRLNRVRIDSAAEVVERLLQQVSLWPEVKDALDKKPDFLSPGQQQRLCLARALSLGPQVLLLDDPCATLDPGATAQFEELVHELASHYTIVIATRHVQQAARVAKRTAFFYAGAVVEYNFTDVILTTPADLRTENYITGRFG